MLEDGIDTTKTIANEATTNMTIPKLQNIKKKNISRIMNTHTITIMIVEYRLN